MKISQSTILVTGGGSGLGWATAQYLRELGANIGIIDLEKEETREKIVGLGDQGEFFPADITNETQIEAALTALTQRFGPLKAVINCAGVASASKTLHGDKPHPLDLFKFTLEVNLLGTFNVCRMAAATMAENSPGEDGERGVLINTASIAAYDGQMGQVAYAASKGGIVAMTLPMARDLSSVGIRVMAIAPGIFDTPMLALLPEKVRISLGQQVPFPARLGHPQEFAQLAAQIIENPMLNGEVIRLDGALRMGK